MKVDRVINQAIWEHHANTKGFPNIDYLNDLDKIQTVFEIIKKNKPCFQWFDGDYRNYNNLAALYHVKRLDEEEYNLLKEVLL